MNYLRRSVIGLLVFAVAIRLLDLALAAVLPILVVVAFLIVIFSVIFRP